MADPTVDHTDEALRLRREDVEGKAPALGVSLESVHVPDAHGP